MNPEAYGANTPPPGSSIPRPAPRASSPVESGEPPLKEVLVDLWGNTEKLVRQEIALASAELEVKAKKLKTEVAASAVAAGMLLAGTLALVAAIILLLSEAMAPWLAALITSAVTVGGGIILIKTKSPTVADVTPERTLQSLKKDLHTFKEVSK
jgi:putative superfamily III holin-X